MTRMKKVFWVLVVVLVVLVAMVFLPHKSVVVSTTVSQQTDEPLPANDYKTTALVMAGETFNAQIADTPELQELGLSYRTSLGSQDAMLFVFAEPRANNLFWMKGMNFPLDIIWLDSNKTVIYIEPDLSPATYPQGFGPSTPSQYVIEVNAGTVSRLGLKVGDTFAFTCNNVFCMR